MNANDIRLFMEVTTRQAEESFKRQMNETHRRIEMQMSASRKNTGSSGLQCRQRARELWWSENRARAFGEAQ